MTLEEMIATFANAALQTNFSHTAIEHGLRAVLRKHIEPLLSEAYGEGFSRCCACEDDEGTNYARRTINSIIGEANVQGMCALQRKTNQ